MFVFFPTSDATAYRESLRLATELANTVDVVCLAHGPSPLAPMDVHAIRDAFETIWAGRAPDQHGSLFGYRVAIHDFGPFSFL
jgi:hypothetical protein